MKSVRVVTRTARRDVMWQVTRTTQENKLVMVILEAPEFP